MSFSCLVVAESGCGKTHALVSGLRAGFNIRLISVEGNCFPVFNKALKMYKEEIAKGKAPPLKDGQVGIMLPSVKKGALKELATRNAEEVQKTAKYLRETEDLKRARFDKFQGILNSAVAFEDFYTKEKMGSIDTWGDDTILAIDGLTSICEGIKQQHIGARQASTLPDWQFMQEILITLLRTITEKSECNFYLMAHPKKEIDKLKGGTKIYPKSLGISLNSVIPSLFTEVVWAYKDGGNFYWSTDDSECVTRYCFLPAGKKLPQDLGQIKM